MSSDDVHGLLGFKHKSLFTIFNKTLMKISCMQSIFTDKMQNIVGDLLVSICSWKSTYEHILIFYLVKSVWRNIDYDVIINQHVLTLNM